jgi:hypothetical protein
MAIMKTPAMPRNIKAPKPAIKTVDMEKRRRCAEAFPDGLFGALAIAAKLTSPVFFAQLVSPELV